MNGAARAITETERNHAIFADDVAGLVEETFGTELFRMLPVFGVHVRTVQVHHNLPKPMGE